MKDRTASKSRRKYRFLVVGFFVVLLVLFDFKTASAFRDPMPATLELVEVVEVKPAPGGASDSADPVWARATFRLTNTTGKIILLQDYGSGTFRCLVTAQDSQWIEITNDPQHTVPLGIGDSATMVKAFRESEKELQPYQASISYKMKGRPEWLRRLRGFFRKPGAMDFSDIQLDKHANTAQFRIQYPTVAAPAP